MAKKNLDIVNTEETKENVLDINLGAIEKRPIRLNGDNTKIIYLNLSDLNIVTRLNEVYPKLKELELEIANLNTADDMGDIEEAIAKFSSTLSEVDIKMREYIDYIFDSNVSSVCAGAGSMYDPINGKMRYEHIIEALSGLYENNLNTEFQKMQTRINKHTSKYHN